MKIIKTIFNFDQLMQVYIRILTDFSIKSEPLKHYIFNILMEYEGLPNTLPIRKQISKLINECFDKPNDSDEHLENDKIQKYLEELLY